MDINMFVNKVNIAVCLCYAVAISISSLEETTLTNIIYLSINAVFSELTDSFIVVFVNVAWQIIQWASEIFLWTRSFKRWYYVKT